MKGLKRKGRDQNRACGRMPSSILMYHGVLAQKMASYRHLPNLPKYLAFLYRNQGMLETLDNSLNWLCEQLLGNEDLGADMTLLFRK